MANALRWALTVTTVTVTVMLVGLEKMPFGEVRTEDH
jgi:hypothetical protein